MDPLAYLFRQTRDGENFANIVLNNTNVCCFSCCGPKRENIGKDMLGNVMAINASLPKMPPVLEGRLDEATWKTLKSAMGNTGGMGPELFLNIFSRLTCTCCCILPCAMACAAAAHEVSVTEFMAAFENHEALKKAGVTIKRDTADIVSPMGPNQTVIATVTVIRFEVAPLGAPTTDSPAAQDMA